MIHGDSLIVLQEDSDLVEILEVRKGSTIIALDSTNVNATGFDECLSRAPDKAKILRSTNPGLELAMIGVYCGPVLIKDYAEHELVQNLNSERVKYNHPTILWRWEECEYTMTKRPKIRDDNSVLANPVYNENCSEMSLSSVFNGTFPGKEHTNFQSLPAVITHPFYGEAPQESIRVKDGGVLVNRDVLHVEKIREMSSLVKYCAISGMEDVQKVLMEVATEMEHNNFSANDNTRAVVDKLSQIAQNKRMINRSGGSFNPGNIRVAWCNVMNSFLRRDNVMFGFHLRVLLHHLEAGK